MTPSLLRDIHFSNCPAWKAKSQTWQSTSGLTGELPITPSVLTEDMVLDSSHWQHWCCFGECTINGL
jgi:hypothetical protein